MSIEDWNQECQRRRAIYGRASIGPLNSADAGPVPGATKRGRRPPAPGETDLVPRLTSIVYVVIGVLVASQHSYYGHLGSLSQVLSAVVATALWPLVILGADLHLSLSNL